MKTSSLNCSNNYDVAEVDPFYLYPILQKAMKEDGVDLSRGDPLDPPSIRANLAFAFFLTFAELLQRRCGQISSDIDSQWGEPPSLEEIEFAWCQAKQAFSSIEVGQDARSVVQDALLVRKRLVEIAESTRLDATEYALLRRVARQIQGCTYDDPAGDELIRAIVADYLTKWFHDSSEVPDGFSVSGEEVILTCGASEAIGAIFRLLETVGYLHPDDCVATVSPIYYPYLRMAVETLGLLAIPLRCSPTTAYEPTEAQWREFEAELEALPGVPKLFVLVNPSNPTGTAYSGGFLARLGRLIEETGAIAIEDIVYHEFVVGGPYLSLWQHVPKHTLLVNSMSKYFRATGTRFGYIIVKNECSEWMSEQRLSDCLHGDKNKYLKPEERTEDVFRDSLLRAKAPGPQGVFYHTHHLPRPAQWFGAFRLLLGTEDARVFGRDMEMRWDAVCQGLGLGTLGRTATEQEPRSPFAPYYCLVDFLALVEERAKLHSSYKNLAAQMRDDRGNPWKPWGFFRRLAEEGVTVLPAAKFFGRESRDHVWVARISVANQSLVGIRRAVHKINDYLKRLAEESAREGQR